MLIQFAITSISVRRSGDPKELPTRAHIQAETAPLGNEHRSEINLDLSVEDAKKFHVHDVLSVVDKL